MIHKYTDKELRNMGIAEYHIRKWHEEEMFNRAIERTKNDFALLDGLFDGGISKLFDDVSDKIKKSVF